MIILAGVELANNKRIDYALTKIYGIGLIKAKKILNLTKIDSTLKVYQLTEINLLKIRQILASNYIIEKTLKRNIELNIKHLIDIKCLRGNRHKLKLPVRGQRTRTNARTKRGSKKTVAGKKK